MQALQLRKEGVQTGLTPTCPVAMDTMQAVQLRKVGMQTGLASTCPVVMDTMQAVQLRKEGVQTGLASTCPVVMDTMQAVQLRKEGVQTGLASTCYPAARQWAPMRTVGVRLVNESNKPSRGPVQTHPAPRGTEQAVPQKNEAIPLECINRSHEPIRGPMHTLLEPRSTMQAVPLWNEAVSLEAELNESQTPSSGPVHSSPATGGPLQAVPQRNEAVPLEAVPYESQTPSCGPVHSSPTTGRLLQAVPQRNEKVPSLPTDDNGEVQLVTDNYLLNAWTWLDDHEEEFQKVKKLLTSTATVKPFDPEKNTALLTDTSRLHGIGFALLQFNKKGEISTILCGSSSLTDTQRRYATIELECMAIQYGATKCSYYLQGLTKFEVWTDHRPMVGVFCKHIYALENPRLMRMHGKLMHYHMEVKCVEGKTHFIADALSRAPVLAPCTEVEEIEHVISCPQVISDPGLSYIEKCINDEYRSMISTITNGWDGNELQDSNPAKPLQRIKERLSIRHNGTLEFIILDGIQLIPPAPVRSLIMKALHTAHSGATKMFATARQLYYWSGMENTINSLTASCTIYSLHQKSNPRASLRPTPPSTAAHLMHNMATDLFEAVGKQWIVLVDRFSGYCFIQDLRSTTTASILKHLVRWFNDYGWPSVIRGSQFRGEFLDFCQANGIKHALSAPDNPESNGLAEAACKSMKALIIKCTESKTDIQTALVNWRNMTREDGTSPADLFFLRRQRQPDLPELLSSQARSSAVTARDKLYERNISYKNKSRTGKFKYSIGDRALIQDMKTKLWPLEGVITGIREDGESFHVKADSGKELIRNQKFLKHSNIFQNLDNTPEDFEYCNKVHLKADSVAPVLKDHAYALPSLEKEDIPQGLDAREHYKQAIRNHLRERILDISVEDTKEAAQQIRDFNKRIQDLTAVSQTAAETKRRELRERWSTGSSLESSQSRFGDSLNHQQLPGGSPLLHDVRGGSDSSGIGASPPSDASSGPLHHVQGEKGTEEGAGVRTLSPETEREDQGPPHAVRVHGRRSQSTPGGPRAIRGQHGPPASDQHLLEAPIGDAHASIPPEPFVPAPSPQWTPIPVNSTWTRGRGCARGPMGIVRQGASHAPRQCQHPVELAIHELPRRLMHNPISNNPSKKITMRMEGYMTTMDEITLRDERDFIALHKRKVNSDKKSCFQAENWSRKSRKKEESMKKAHTEIRKSSSTKKQKKQAVKAKFSQKDFPLPCFNDFENEKPTQLQSHFTKFANKTENLEHFKSFHISLHFSKSLGGGVMTPTKVVSNNKDLYIPSSINSLINPENDSYTNPIMIHISSLPYLCPFIDMLHHDPTIVKIQSNKYMISHSQSGT
jgi:transposase InsO family protein